MTLFNNLPGDNTENIWAYRFLAKPKTIEAGGLGGAVSPPWGPGPCFGEHVVSNLFFFLVQHDKMVIVMVNIG